MGASVPYPEHENLITTRTGRVLEVREYGDPAGHPAIFFHGLIGSHHQASYIAEQAMRHELRIIAPNRPGVGQSKFVERKSAPSRLCPTSKISWRHCRLISSA